MARHAAPTNDGSRTSFTIRLPPATGSGLHSHAQACNAALTQFVLGFLGDLRTWFGLREDVPFHRRFKLATRHARREGVRWVTAS